MTLDDEVHPYGFQWGSDTDQPVVQVTRLMSVDRGKRKGGKCRVLRVSTERDNIQVYVTQTGRVRVFCDKGEMKVA